MKRRWIGWSLGFVLAVLGSALAWALLSGGSGSPSTGLTTPPIADATPTTLPAGAGSTTTGGVGESTTSAGAGEEQVFVIDAERSNASYSIGETLNGRRNIAVGTTQEIAGQFAVDASGAVRFSPIIVNARTFVSDSSTRDRLVRGPVILNSAQDEFEFITFEVSEVVGGPDDLPVGQRAEFSIVGDLTIKGVTQVATFNVTVIRVDENTISGEAVAVVLRSDFGIGIPSVPSVADVDDEVTIRLEFFAVSA